MKRVAVGSPLQFKKYLIQFVCLFCRITTKTKRGGKNHQFLSSLVSGSRLCFCVPSLAQEAAARREGQAAVCGRILGQCSDLHQAAQSRQRLFLEQAAAPRASTRAARDDEPMVRHASSLNSTCHSAVRLRWRVFKSRPGSPPVCRRAMTSARARKSETRAGLRFSRFFLSLGRNKYSFIH